LKIRQDQRSRKAIEETSKRINKNYSLFREQSILVAIYRKQYYGVRMKYSFSSYTAPANPNGLLIARPSHSKPIKARKRD